MDLNSITRLADDRDNVAIATQRLQRGQTLRHGADVITVSHTVLEGHRLAVRGIQKGEPLLSWGLPFATATQAIQPGDYICNDLILTALRQRKLDLDLPHAGNFSDVAIRYQLDEADFQPGQPVERYGETRTFEGFARGSARGVGTRNMILVLGTSSRVSAYVEAIAGAFEDIAADYERVDGVVAAAHTEGGTLQAPNNRQLLLRTLAGFIVHPNIGAVLVLDEGSEPVNNDALEVYMKEHGYALQEVPHRFMSLGDSIETSLKEARQQIHDWLIPVNAVERSQQPLSALKIALQCGGSDAFSGVSANPLVGWVARELIRHGGGACLAETTELIGAEPYVLKSVRDLDTARTFLRMIEDYRRLASRHGHSPEGNPSGGNRLRGLYNIIVKSIGAARKKAPDVRLEHCIPYSGRMPDGGFVFMDSPGNDLESIAGQVAAGCNLIFFTTGNGSITNFAFAPTIKIVTTTGRYELLKKDMDVNAGAYLDGTPMPELGAATFERMIRVASGERTVGEEAGHYQVHIWRDWNLAEEDAAVTQADQTVPDGNPVRVHEGGADRGRAPGTARIVRHPRIGLILPTSLCSSQVAALVADRLNKANAGTPGSVARYVALPHTEGCGCATEDGTDIGIRTLVNHALHPSVTAALMLEHGCEKFHNDMFQTILQSQGCDVDRFGWASIQLDGGIEAVSRKIEDWSREHARPTASEISRPFTIGFLFRNRLDDVGSNVLEPVLHDVLAGGGGCVIAATQGFAESVRFAERILHNPVVSPSLAYGQQAGAGLHIMDAPTGDDQDILTGLAGTGTEVIVAVSGGRPLQAHPFVPVVQVSTGPGEHGRDGFDVQPSGDKGASSAALLACIIRSAQGDYTPHMLRRGLTAFQISRGRTKISL